jgi:hypothetical protein
VLVAGGLVAIDSRTRAASPPAPAGHTAAATGRVPDASLSRSILQAYDADLVLRDANLVVSVVDGVAVVGGPVPTAEAARRAGELARAVRDVKEVRNKCFIQTGPDPLLTAVAGRLPPGPSRATTFGLPGVVSSPRPGATPDESAADSFDTSFATADPPAGTVVARRPVNPGDSVLLPPVGLGKIETSPVAPVVPPVVRPTMLTSVPPLPAPATVPGRPADVQVAAEAVRKADRRYAGLTVEVQNGMLVIAGTAARNADAWDLAQELRRIPGIARVAVGAVEVR